MKNYSSYYADFILNLTYNKLGSDVVLQAKKLIMDFIGVALAGYKLMEFPRGIVEYMKTIGGTPEATIIQTKKKFPAIHAAFANAACGHSLDMDDGHRFAALHPGTVIIPAAIAAAEVSNVDMKTMITGIVAGYEVMIRIGSAINPSSLNRGFHSTGTIGPFGAVAAASKILNLNHEEIVGAFGLAGLQGSGLLQVNHEGEGARVKPIAPAKAAMSGLFSCILAKKGVRGPLNIFEGEDGFFKAFTDDLKTNLLIQGLGEEFEICKAYIKFYSACRHAHAPIDAALMAFRNARIHPSRIAKIEVSTYPVAIRLAGVTEVTTPSVARFSIPYSIALALTKGDAGVDKYCEEFIRDPQIQELSRKIELSVGEKWEKSYPEKRGATVRIIGEDGKEWKTEVELAKGEPENPATWEEVFQKFYTNVKLILPEEEGKKLGDILTHLEDSSIKDLVRLV